MITVKFGGIYKDRVAKKYKKGIKLEAKSIAEIIEALNQDSIFSDDLVELLRTYKASFVLGRSVRQGRPSRQSKQLETGCSVQPVKT